MGNTLTCVNRDDAPQDANTQRINQKYDDATFNTSVNAMNIALQAAKYEQGHLFDNITPDQIEQQKPEEKEKTFQYLTQLAQIDFELMSRLYKNQVEEGKKIDSHCLERVDNQFDLQSEESDEYKAANKAGLTAIAEGKVAIVVMAGGQGSRLGYSGPKGCMNLEIGDDKQNSITLFNIFANKVKRLQELAREQNPAAHKSLIQLYIMTSSATHCETVKYFNENNHFGLQTRQVHFFSQANLPAVSQQGKIVNEDKFKVFMAPNGNGGFFDAIQLQLPSIKKQNIEYIHVVGVDNILNKLADPVLVGNALNKKLDFVSKFVKKVNPDEKVGLHVLHDGKFQIVEYSEIDEKGKTAKQGDELKLNQGFLATFLIKVDLLQELLNNKNTRSQEKYLKSEQKRCEQELKNKSDCKQTKARFDEVNEKIEKIGEFQGWEQYHKAEKELPVKCPQTGNPEKVRGFKFEQFIFDGFAQICRERVGLQEVDRCLEFAPIKNKDYVLDGEGKLTDKANSDSKKTAKILQSKLHLQWLKKAGYTISQDLEDSIDGEKNYIFISPSRSYFGENLEGDKKEIKSLPFIL